jgi:hypothetical protein
LFFQKSLAGLFFLENRFHPYRLQSQSNYLEMMERLRNNILVKPIDTEQWI